MYNIKSNIKHQLDKKNKNKYRFKTYLLINRRIYSQYFKKNKDK